MVGFEQQGELWQQVLCQVSTVVSARSFWWPRATFVRAILGPCFFSSVMLDAVCNTTLVHITGSILVFMPISWRQYEQSAFRFFTVFTMSWRSTAKQQNQIDGITTFIYTWYGLTKQMISELHTIAPIEGFSNVRFGKTNTGMDFFAPIQRANNKRK